MEERSLSAKARKKVKDELEKSNKDRKLKMFQRRMELARQGTVYYKQGKMKDAVNCFYKYLDVLEQWKEAKQGTLEPKHFDHKKDVAELLLLTGIFWDLAKLYDRAGKKEEVRLKSFLDRYVLFSKGMPYQHVCAELCRKYLVNGNPVHRGMFKDVHVALGGGKCFIATAVEDYCEPETLPILRKFRDEVLLQNLYGKAFVAFYYCVGPWLARGLLRLPEAVQKSTAKVIVRIAYLIKP